jgi:hypothetical protein
MAFAEHKVTLKFYNDFTMKIPKKDRLWCNLNIEPNTENHVIAWKKRNGKHTTLSRSSVACLPFPVFQ